MSRALLAGVGFVAIAILAAGCGDSRRAGPPRTDSGTGDGGMMADSGGVDSGGVDGGVCPPLSVSPPDTPVCQMSTVTCIVDAMDAAAYDACLAADPMGEACADCLEQDLLACGTAAGGCAQQAGDLDCCAQERCPDGDPACEESMCAAQNTAFDDCVIASVRAGTCGVTLACAVPASGFLS